MPDTPSKDALIRALTTPLYSDFDASKHLPQKRPLLAHYTSVDNMRNILIGEELWFSNPLSMNDYEELYFGLQHGMQAIRAHKDLFQTCTALGCYEASRASLTPASIGLTANTRLTPTSPASPSTIRARTQMAACPCGAATVATAAVPRSSSTLRG